MKEAYNLCLRCKGARRLCGLPYCPLIEGFRARVKAVESIHGNEVSGSTPPTIVVGEHGYPRVRVYYGVPPGIHGLKAKEYDSPDKWFLRLGLDRIIELRSNLLSLVLPAYIYDPYKLYEKEIGLAVVSSKPVDSEAVLKEKPIPRITFDSITPPRGPSASVQDVRITSNPSLNPRLEKLIWDDLRASEGVWLLYREGLDFYTIVRALTIGFLGRSGQRRLVPTRWGITAVDSMISSKLLSRIKKSPIVNGTLVFYSEYLHNKYIVVLVPGRYRGLWIEVWQPHSLWNPKAKPSTLIVKEDYRGRMNVVDGGYLAARTSVLEYLYSIGRQARIAILREVLPQYMFPVGNWQIRLTVSHALRKKPVLRDPDILEFIEFINRATTNIPSNIVSLLIQYIYRFREEPLDKWI